MVSMLLMASDETRGCRLRYRHSSDVCSSRERQMPLWGGKLYKAVLSIPLYQGTSLQTAEKLAFDVV